MFKFRCIILASAVFLLSSGYLFSQEESYAFSAYSNFPISNVSDQNWQLPDMNISWSNSAFGYISPAVLFYKENGNFQEFEISRIGVNTTDATVYSLDSLNGSTQLVSGASVADINVALRYNYSFLIGGLDGDSRFKFYIGAAAGPYFQRKALKPMTSNLFPVSTSTGGLRVSAIPAITYSLNEHLFLNLDFPLTIANVSVSGTKSENPEIPISERKTTTTNFDLFPAEILLRFGLGLRI